jgi:hypothetical protein
MPIAISDRRLITIGATFWNEQKMNKKEKNPPIL